MCSHLSPDSVIVHSKLFESGIVKILNDDFDSLSLDEKKVNDSKPGDNGQDITTTESYLGY